MISLDYPKYLLLLTATIAVHLSEIRVVQLPIVQEVSLLYVLGPPLIIIFPFIVDKVEISRIGISWSYVYISLVFVLILGHPLDNLLTVFDHVLILLLGIIIVSILNSNQKYGRYVIQGVIIGTIPVLVLDTFGFIGITPFMRGSGFLNTIGIYRGGIGVLNTSFGAHGVILISGLWCIWYIGHKNRGSLYTGGYFLFVAVIIFFILLSNSRSSYMALLLGIVSAFTLNFIRTNNYAVPVFLFGGLSLFAIFIIILNPDSLIERVNQLIVSFNVISQYPLRGIGWNNFYLTYYSRSGLHNSLIYYFVAGGIVPGTLMTIFIFYPIIICVVYAIESKIGRWHIALFGIYVAAVFELFLWRSTPNAHQIVFGFILIESIYGNITAR